MNNEERDQQLYRYSNSSVLRNKLDVRDGDVLGRAEARLVENRIEQGVPSGNFDQAHLCRIHRHLFQDVYEWAGEFREVNIAKGSSGFHPYNRLILGMADIHSRLAGRGFLDGLTANDFSEEAAEYIGDLNRLHPFREGNGRTQLQYLKLLGQNAGHEIDLTQLERKSWVQASIEANKFETSKMADCIRSTVQGLSRAQNRPLSEREQALLDSHRTKNLDATKGERDQGREDKDRER